MKFDLWIRCSEEIEALITIAVAVAADAAEADEERSLMKKWSFIWILKLSVSVILNQCSISFLSFF